MLTARGEEIDRILGLEMGAAAYVTKPFSPQELRPLTSARCCVALNPYSRLPRWMIMGERPLVYDALRIDPQRRLVQAHRQEIVLTARKVDLLWLLARHPRQVFTHDQLLDLVWGVTGPI